MKQVSGQMNVFDPGMPYGKMSPVHSVPTKEKISASFSKSSAKSKTTTPLYLDLRKGGSGILAEPSWEMGIPCLGACSTHVFGESPSVAEESGLSRILEENAPLKYYLSARACAGVLRRAEKRGKQLPEILETALKQQIERWQKYGTPIPPETETIKSESVYDTRDNGDGVIAPTITGDHNNRVTDDTVISIGRAAFHSGENTQFSSSVSESGIAQTITARGPGGVCYAIGNGQTNQMKLSDAARTLNCMHDQQAVLIAPEQTKPVYIVRCLTPLECCRLQGMPDFWCDGIPHSDTQEYRMWGNGMALPNALYIMEGVADAFAKKNPCKKIQGEKQ